MYIGESTVKIKTEADSNDITETASPLHDKPSTGMSGFLCCHCLSLYHMFGVCIVFYCCSFLYTDVAIITVVDEYKHSHTVTLHLHFTCVTFVIIMAWRQFI